MRDEEYIFHTDVAQKKSIARSSKHRRSHGGRGGCELPSDCLSKKELRKMNGDVKEYKLNEPMSYSEFKKMPEDLRREYLKRIIQRFDAPRGYIGKMLGCGSVAMANQFGALGFGHDTRAPRRSWKKAEFEMWCRGTQETEPPTEEENEVVVLDESTVVIPETTVAITPSEEPVVETPLICAGELNYRFEYYRKCEELEKAKMELEILESKFNDLHELLIEAKAIKRTLYVIFGRRFDGDRTGTD